MKFEAFFPSAVCLRGDKTLLQFLKIGGFENQSMFWFYIFIFNIYIKYICILLVETEPFIKIFYSVSERAQLAGRSHVERC